MTTYKQLVADHEEYVEGQQENARDAARYVIYSRKRRAWWAPKASGYVAHLDQAGRYTEAEARQIEAGSSYGPEHSRSVAMTVADARKRGAVA